MNISGAIKDKIYDLVANRVRDCIEAAIDQLDGEDIVDDDYITDCISDALSAKLADYTRDIVDDVIDDVLEDLDL